MSMFNDIAKVHLALYSAKLANGEVVTFGAPSRRQAVADLRFFGYVAEGDRFTCRLAGQLDRTGVKVEHWHGPFRLSFQFPIVH